MSDDRETLGLETQARYARERFQLYKAKAYGPKPTSPARLRELESQCIRAETRLRRARTVPAEN